MSKKAASRSPTTSSSSQSTRSSDLYRFHRPKLNLHETPHPLKRESRHALRNLASYRSVRPSSPLPFYPRSQCAAVLVALFVGRIGDLYVLLSRRAETLRSYAGDTSLPGGKVDPEDRTIEDTARREAFEEIGLPRDKHKVPLLCVLEPFLAGNSILVTPVVVLILDNTLRPMLNAPEVHTLFSHPLASFLSISAPFTTTTSPGPTDAEEASDTQLEQAAFELPYYTYHDLPWPPGPGGWTRSTTRSRSRSSDGRNRSQDGDKGIDKFRTEDEGRGDDNKEYYVRMHRFLTGREQGGVKPVYGLTAAILIHIAAQAYGHPPSFDIQALHQPSMHERIAWALLHEPRLLEACVAEDVDPEKAADGWIKEGRRVRKEENRRGKGGRRRKGGVVWAKL